jgi:hypothetical protein
LTITGVKLICRPVDGEEVGLRVRFEVFLRGVGAEDGLRIVQRNRTIVDRRDRKVAQLEAPVGGLVDLFHFRLGMGLADGHGLASGAAAAATAAPAIICRRDSGSREFDM